MTTAALSAIPGLTGTDDSVQLLLQSKSIFSASGEQPTKLANFINGEYLAPAAGQYFDSPEPATDTVLVRVPDSTSADVDAAVKAAKDAFPAWSRTSHEARSQLLLKVAQLLDERADEFALAESRDQGKPVWLAKAMDISRSAANFRYYATYFLHAPEHAAHHEYHVPSSSKPGQMETKHALSYTQRQPVGVGALVSPWNLPLYLLSWKIAPCIAAGNTCVCKPSEFTSVTAYLLCQVLADAGIPAGVVNMVFGTGRNAGGPLTTHTDVDLISFTGGTVTGGIIAKAVAPTFKKLSLELGGKNPNIIFADCNLETAVRTSVRSSFLNQGEICLCGSRILVERSILDKFSEQFTAAVEKQVIIGDPLAPGVFMGPVVSKQHFQKVTSYINHAFTVEEQAKAASKPSPVRVIYGGNYNVQHLDDSSLSLEAASQVKQLPALNLPERVKNGYFIQPTIIVCEDRDSKLLKEEIFGPVVTITPFDTEEEAVELANATEYGLAASVWSNNDHRLRRVAAALHIGTVWCNCWLIRELSMPFGGMKNSGVGREGGAYSVDFYTEAKAICLG
ncbi:aldehyde dehydrogenase [Ramicandelaber brevisporus]|nr:aldehyde dehydrogenase [Ramicandelaber brevisporus]